MIRVGRLHILTDGELQARFTHVELAGLALEGGADTIQYRRKSGSARVLIAEAAEIRGICRRKGVPLIVNDRVDIALAADADGVHLGTDDLPLPIARSLLGPARIIGGSVDTGDEARGRTGADYLGIGPVFPTRSKVDTGPMVGLSGLRQAVRVSPLPLIAIGGIDSTNIDEVLATGVHGVAVLGAVCLAPDPAQATASLHAAVARRFGT